MFKRYWGLYLSFGIALAGVPLIWLWLQPKQPNLPRAQYEQARSGNYKPESGQCAPKVLAAIPDRRISLREANACAKEAEDHRLQTNDLIQQTRAADAAQAQSLLAYQAVLIGVLQTIGGFLTLVAAGAAALYARSAAQAAQSALSHDRRVHELMNRPYVVFGRITFKCDEYGNYIVKIRTRNAGSCIATNIQLDLVVSYNEFPISRSDVGKVPASLNGLPIIAPNSVPTAWISRGLFLTEEQIAKIRSAEAGLFASAAIRYQPLPDLPKEEIICDWVSTANQFQKGRFTLIPSWVFGEDDHDGQGNLTLIHADGQEEAGGDAFTEQPEDDK